MTPSEIPANVSIFIDMNCLIYAATADPRYGPACERLLHRIDKQEIQGFTAAHVLSELAHRVMTLEAVARFNRPLAGIANWLRRHPSQVQQLTRHRQAIDEVKNCKIQILPVDGADVSRAADLSIPFGLLSADALVVTVMQHHGLSCLASFDADFDRVSGITRYVPV